VQIRLHVQKNAWLRSLFFKGFCSLRRLAAKKTQKIKQNCVDSNFALV